MNDSSIKIKEKLVKQIYKIAEETNTNSSFHVNIALQNYIEEQKDLKIALKRMKNKSDLIISSKQLRKSLGL